MSKPRSYFAGVRMAYEDCAKMAEDLAKKQEPFIAFAVAAGCAERDAKITAQASEACLEAIAKSIREKLANVEAMIVDADARYESTIFRGTGPRQKPDFRERSEIANKGRKSAMGQLTNAFETC